MSSARSAWTWRSTAFVMAWSALRASNQAAEWKTKMKGRAG